MTPYGQFDNILNLFSDHRLQIYCSEQGGTVEARKKTGEKITIQNLPSCIAKKSIAQAKRILRNVRIIKTLDGSFRLDIRLRGGMFGETKYFEDPITFEIMRNPTKIKTCGCVFESTTLEGRNRCPVDQRPFSQEDLEPDVALRARINREFPSNPMDIVIVPPLIVNPAFVENSKKSVFLYGLVKEEIDESEFIDAQQRFRELSTLTSKAEHFALQPLIYEGLLRTCADDQHPDYVKHKTCIMYSYLYLGKLYSREELTELALDSFRTARRLAQELNLEAKHQDITEDYIEALNKACEYQEMVTVCIELGLSYKLLNPQKANRYFQRAEEVCKEQEEALRNPKELRLRSLQEQFELSDQPKERFSIAFAQGDVNQELGNYQEAYEKYTEARNLHFQIDPVPQIETCQKLVDVALLLIDPSQVLLEYIELARAYKASKIPDKYNKYNQTYRRAFEYIARHLTTLKVLPDEINGSFLFIEPVDFNPSDCYVTAARLLARVAKSDKDASNLYLQAIAANLDNTVAQEELLDLYLQHHRFKEAVQEMLILAFRLRDQGNFPRALWAMDKLSAISNFQSYLTDQQIRDYRKCEVESHLAIAKKILSDHIAFLAEPASSHQSTIHQVLSILVSESHKLFGFPLAESTVDNPVNSFQQAVTAFQELESPTELDHAFQATLQLFEEAKDYQACVEGHLGMAKSYCRFSHTAYAEPHFISAYNTVTKNPSAFKNPVDLKIEIYRSYLDNIPDCSSKAEILVQLGDLFSIKKDSKQAYEYYNQARESYEAQQSPPPSELCEKLLKTAINLRLTTKIVHEYFYLGALYANQKKYSKSNASYAKGLSSLQSSKKGITKFPPNFNENFSFHEPASFNTEPYYLIVAKQCSKRAGGFVSAHAHYQRILKKNVSCIEAQEGLFELLQNQAPQQQVAEDMFGLCSQLFASRLFARTIWAIEKIRTIPNHESYLNEDWRSINKFAPLIALALESEIRISNMESQIRRYKPLTSINNALCLIDLARMKHLTKVDFSRCVHLTDDAFRALESYDLEKLDLSDCRMISSRVIGTVIPRFQNLRKLRMRKCTQIQPQALGRIIESCTNLDQLDLRGAQQTQFISKENSDDSDLLIPRFLYSAYKGDQVTVEKYLKSGLNIESRDIAGNTSLTHARSQGHHPVMKILIVQDATLPPDFSVDPSIFTYCEKITEIAKILTRVPSITAINLNGIGGIDSILELIPKTNATSLDMSNCRLIDDQVENAAARLSKTKIKTLNLARNQLKYTLTYSWTAQAPKYLKMFRNAGLTALDLSHNDFGNIEAVQRIMHDLGSQNYYRKVDAPYRSDSDSSPNFKQQLSSLNLSHTNLDYRAAGNLITAVDIPQINLDGNPIIEPWNTLYQLILSGRKDILLAGDRLVDLALDNHDFSASDLRLLWDLLPALKINTLSLKKSLKAVKFEELRSDRTFGRREQLGSIAGVSIKRIDLSDNDLNDDELSQLLYTLPWDHITELNLSKNKIGLKTLKALTQMHEFDSRDYSTRRKPRISQLLDLDLSITGLNSDGMRMIADILPQCQMKSLNLWINHAIGIEGVRALAQTLSRSQIEWLSLGAVDIDCTGIQALTRALQQSKVSELHLHQNKIGTRGAQALAGILKRIRVLNLNHNSIGNEGTEALARALLAKPATTRLDLYKNDIGKEGVLTLAEAIPGSNILEMNLLENKIGIEGVAILRDIQRRHPQIQLHYSDPL